VLRFLDEGDKVKATIFSGARNDTAELGPQILERLIKDVDQRVWWSFGHAGRQYAALILRRTRRKAEQKKRKRSRTLLRSRATAAPQGGAQTA